MANEYCADVFVQMNLVNSYTTSGEMMGCEPVDVRVVVNGYCKCVCSEEFG